MKTPPPEPGVYENVPGETYRDWDAVNIGVLEVMRASPLACLHARTHPRPRSASMDKGVLLHACMLEPGRIERDVIPPPGRMVADKDTGAESWREYGRDTQAWARYEAANPGKIICADADRDAIREMLRRFRDDKYARGAIFDPERRTEISVAWRDEGTGLACKCRPDVVLPEALPDLKTTEITPLSPYLLRQHATRLGWFWRAAWYERGWRAATGESRPVWFVLAQSVPPHEIVVCRPSDAARAGASRLIDGWLASYARCAADDHWPGMAPEPITLTGPDWLESMGSALEGIDESEYVL